MYYFHMFFTFFIFSQSLDRFNLNPPFEMTDVNEIGNWSLVGSTVNRKFALQLTTGVESEYGALCYRSPFVYSNFTWMFDVSFSDLPGNGFYLYFTNEVCQLKTNSFTGVAYFIDTSDISPDLTCPIYFLDNSNGTIKEISKTNFVKIGSLQFSTKRSHIIFGIEKTEKRMRLTYAIEFDPQPVFLHRHNGIFSDLSYFSIVAENGPTSTSSVFLHTAVLFTLEQPKEFDDTKLLTKNRKIITTKFYERKLKKERRLSKMPIYQFYYK